MNKNLNAIKSKILLVIIIIISILIIFTLFPTISNSSKSTNNHDISNQDTNKENINKDDSNEEDFNNVQIINVAIEELSSSSQYLNLKITLKNNTDKNIRFTRLNLYFYDSDNNIVFSDTMVDSSVIRPGANQIIEKLVQANGWISVESEIDSLRFEKVSSTNKDNSTPLTSDSNDIDPIKIVSNIIPYGNFEIDREESRDGIDYFVIKCSDETTSVVTGWYYLRKSDNQLFELNLANNSLIEVIKSNNINSSTLYNKLLGHWLADNGVEYWYGDKYQYCYSVTGLSKENISYISDREYIINYFTAHKDAIFMEYITDNRNLTVKDFFLNNDIINNCVIAVIVDKKNDYVFNEVIVLSEDGKSFKSYVKLDTDLFTYSGVNQRIDNKTTPN